MNKRNNHKDLLLEAAQELTRAYNHADPDCPLCGGQARHWDPLIKGRGHGEGCLIKRLIAAAYEKNNKPQGEEGAG